MENLFIIGNGFDLYHKYKTSYLDFKEYLKTHSKNYPVGTFHLYDVFSDIDEKTWSDLENQLAYIDFSRWAREFSTNLNTDLSDSDFDRELGRNKSLLDSFKDIKEKLLSALSCALNDFIIEATKKSVSEKGVFKKLFKEPCFITFNYSKLLENIYSIDSKSILHIHGETCFRRITHEDYEYDTLYNNVSIIFGHGKDLVPEENDSDIDFFNPHNVLKTISNELRKSYQIQKLEKFVKAQKPEKAIIIGHGLGEVDFPYFRKLNEVLINSAEICYWLYNSSELKEKKKVLEDLFGDKAIIIQNYSNEILYKS